MPKEKTRKDQRATEKAVRISSVASTEAQNSLGEILGRVTRGERVFITRYGRRQAVLLSAEAYADLMGQAPVDLTELEDEFDERVDRMQTSEHAVAVDALFRMSEEELGEAATRSATSEPSDEDTP